MNADEKRIESDVVAFRSGLEKANGQVWDTEQLTKEFEVTGFQAPFVVVVRKEDGVKGAMEFTHMPRFYFSFNKI